LVAFPPSRPVEVAPKFVKPDLAKVRAETDYSKPLISPEHNQGTASVNVVKLTDELLATLKQDEMVRGVLDKLGGQIVKVTED